MTFETTIFVYKEKYVRYYVLGNVFVKSRHSRHNKTTIMTSAYIFKIFKIVFIGSLVFLILLETAARILLGLDFMEVKKRIDSRMLNEQHEENVLGYDTAEAFWIDRDILHPYLGYVHNPAWNDTSNPAPDIGDYKYNMYGFIGDSPVEQRSSEKVIIGITGGSVAESIYIFSKDTLIDELRKYSEYSNKEIEVKMIGMAGYKQPQQLLTLTYLLSLGAEFDIVVNIDGFNEVALTYADNWKYNITPSFPRLWNLYSQKNLENKKLVKEFATIAEIKEKKILQKEKIAKFPLDLSVFARLLWAYIDTRYDQRIATALKTIQEEPTRSEVLSGVTEYMPHQTDEDELLKEAVAIWKKSSIEMNKISEANDIQYFHFLQPSQYFVGSKELTLNEKKYAFFNLSGLTEKEGINSAIPDYKYAVEQSYSVLVNEGMAIKKQGVSFIDLTQIFSETKEDIYKDRCCHYNNKGNEIVAREIARQIANY
jgi:hypothetical protein